MSDRMTPLDDARDLIFLLSHSAKFIPDNPTLEGWDAERIKKAYWYPIKILYEWLKRAIDESGELEADLDDVLDEIPTFAKLAASQTFSGVNTFSEIIPSSISGAKTITDYTFFKGNVDLGSSGSDNSKTLNVYYTTNLRGPLTTSTILPVNAGFTIGTSDHPWNSVFTESINLGGKIYQGSYQFIFPEKSGNIALESYVDAAEAAAKAYADTELGKLLGGDYVAKRATCDEAGNDIQTYYVAHSDVVNSLDSTSTVNPLSAYQGKVLKGLIDGINAILASDDDALDEIQEIVTYIKSNKSLIDAITVTKISYTDIVNDLVSQLATKPLSANQGYVLDQKKIDKADIEDSLNSSSATKVLSANQGRILAGLIANVSNAYDAKIEELEEWAGDIDQAEAGRVEAEAGRVEAEQGRVEAEQGRVEAEEAREGRIEALESGLAETKELAKIAYFAHGSTLSTVSDTTLAAIKAVPAGAQRFASLDGFKGNSVRWKQLVRTSNISSATERGITYSCTDGVFTYNGTATGGTAGIQFNDLTVSITAGHKYLINFVGGGSSSTYQFTIGTTGERFDNPLVYSKQSSFDTNVRLLIYEGVTVTNLKSYCNIIDLTDMGIDTTDVDVAKAELRKRGINPDVYNPYSGGEIRDSLSTKLYSRKAGLNSLKLNEIGAYTFTGNETWTQHPTNGFYTTALSNLLIANVGQSSPYELINDMGLTVVAADSQSAADNSIAVSFNKNLFIRDTVHVTSEVTAQNYTRGKTIYFKIASPLSEPAQAVIDGLVIAEYPLTLPTLRSAGSVQDTEKKANIGSYTFTGNESVTRVTSGTSNSNTFTIANSSLPDALKGKIRWASTNAIASKGKFVGKVGSNSLSGWSDITSANPSGPILFGFYGTLVEVYFYLSGVTTATDAADFIEGITINFELANPTDQADVEIPDLIEVEEGGSLELVCEGTTAEFDVTYLVEAE